MVHCQSFSGTKRDGDVTQGDVWAGSRRGDGVTECHVARRERLHQIREFRALEIESDAGWGPWERVRAGLPWAN